MSGNEEVHLKEYHEHGEWDLLKTDVVSESITHDVSDMDKHIRVIKFLKWNSKICNAKIKNNIRKRLSLNI